MNCKKLLPIIPIAFTFFSCHNNSESALKDESYQELKETIQSPQQKKQDQTPIPTGQAQQTDTAKTASNESPQTSANIDWDKKIIKTATLKFEVKDFKTYSANIYKTVKQFGGYIAEENQNTTEEKLESTISIKVPVNQFENIMNSLPGTDVKVVERKISTEDVTGEVVDVKSRLEAKKQMRQRYLDFFKQAKNMEEILQVQSEIDNLQEAMEAATGRVNYLTHQSAMSTINLTFYQPLEGFKPGNESPSFLTRIADAFKTGGVWLGNILVGLISIWPLIIVITLGIFLLKKFTTTKTKQPNS